MKVEYAALVAQPFRAAIAALRRRAGTALAVAAIVLTLAPGVGAQPPASGTPDGFVPLESVAAKEQLPAAPLVIAAYAFAWIAVFGYLWSIWQRLGRVERDLAEVSRRVRPGGGR